MVLKSKLSAILSFIIVFSSLAVPYINVNANSNSQFILESDRTSIKIGDTVKVSLRIKDFPSFAGYQANINYDPTVLKPAYSDGTYYDGTSTPETGDILQKRYSPTDMGAHNLDKGNLTFGRTYMNMASYEASGNPESSGTLAYIYFEVLKTANTEIKLENAASLTNAVSGTMAFDWKGAQFSDYTVLGAVSLTGQVSSQTPTVAATPTASNNVTPTRSAVTGTSTPTNPNRTVTPTAVSNTPAPTKKIDIVTYIPAVIVEDLAISISADKKIYNEGSVITYTIKYKNRTNETAVGAEISADISDFTSFVSGANGSMEDGKIKWNIGNIASNKSGELKYAVKVLPLDKAEEEISTTASISVLLGSEEIAQSTVRVLATSNKFGEVSHKKYIKGYPDNTFKPTKEITRAEAAVMFCNILGIDVSGNNDQVFDDVESDHWAAPYINAVNNAGIFKGVSDGKFVPNGMITRAEMATAIARFLSLSEAEPIEVHFKDISNHWALKYIEEIYRVKITNGYKDGRFLPNNKIKRGEAVTMLNNMLLRGPLTGVPSTFDDVGYDYWAIGHIEEAANDHTSTRSSNGDEAA
ncbi:MAG TPA: S-layer homology domain-containing protein [Pseudobacteroides sp.]|uniref:S-layer homology domain-containing protein n=1 Tax=Pseudobacteroides sp. TaxID=1968840 RepID=UPI002F9212EC